jgi:hypothetical protein
MNNRIFNHITLDKVISLILNAVVIGLASLVAIGLVGIISHIIMNPSVIDNASFGIYG